MQEERPRELY